MKGIFITFEGIDGCGKSTQCELLKDYLKANNKDFIFVREPGGTVIGERIREILLDKKNTQMTARTELLLFEEKARSFFATGSLIRHLHIREWPEAWAWTL